jgi:hypothetical protein
MIFLIAILGAFFNGCRGGLLNVLFSPKQDSIILKRVGKFGNALVFGLVTAFCVNSLLGLLFGFAAMLIGASFGWGKYITGIVKKTFDPNEKEIVWIDNLVMRSTDHAVLRSVAALSLRGLIWTSIIAGFFSFFSLSYLFYAPVGLLMGLVYWASIEICGLFKNRGYGWSLGEFFFGAILWAAFVLIG